MTLTLESIKAEHTRLADMIAAFEAQAATTVVHLPAADITLAAGEHYAGRILGKDGAPDHHVILLPGEAESLAWEAAKAWAAEAGGELPSRREQSLLFCNLREQFQSAWYWSNEQHASDAGYAWYQSFAGGFQNGLHENVQLRARAVRRLIIE